MSLVAAARYSPSQVPNEGPHDQRRQSGAHHYAALRAVHFDGLKVNPPDDADELVSQFDRDALNEVARDRHGLGQVGRLVVVIHQLPLSVLA